MEHRKQNVSIVCEEPDELFCHSSRRVSRLRHAISVSLEEIRLTPFLHPCAFLPPTYLPFPPPLPFSLQLISSIPVFIPVFLLPYCLPASFPPSLPHVLPTTVSAPPPSPPSLIVTLTNFTIKLRTRRDAQVSAGSSNNEQVTYFAYFLVQLRYVSGSSSWGEGRSSLAWTGRPSSGSSMWIKYTKDIVTSCLVGFTDTLLSHYMIPLDLVTLCSFCYRKWLYSNSSFFVVFSTWVMEGRFVEDLWPKQ